MEVRDDTCIVFLNGYPATGKRTVGGHLARLLDGVLVDNALISRPLLELFRWDGKSPLPPEIWQRVIPIREAVLGTIEDLAPRSNSYVFTNVLTDDSESRATFDSVRDLADRRGSLFLSVLLTCDIEVQVGRIDNADRVALRKGSDPEGYRAWRPVLLEPPNDQLLRLDTTATQAATNAQSILDVLISRGYRGLTQGEPLG